MGIYVYPTSMKRECTECRAMTDRHLVLLMRGCDVALCVDCENNLRRMMRDDWLRSPQATNVASKKEE